MSGSADEAPRWLTAKETAAIQHVSRSTVIVYANQGLLPCCRTLGGHRRHQEDEIRAIAATMVHEVRAAGSR